MCYKNEYQKRAHGEVERIFRELFPEAGLHVREEQIRLCHEMLDALMKNEITLCDAGVGIGKTYAYLTACILMRKYSVLHSGYSGCDRRSVALTLPQKQRFLLRSANASGQPSPPLCWQATGRRCPAFRTSPP